MATNYERGRQYEYRTMRHFEALGYECMRTAGSHGVADVICFSKLDTLLVQVKYNCGMTPADEETFVNLPTHPSVKKVLCRWDFRKRNPRVTIF